MVFVVSLHDQALISCGAKFYFSKLGYQLFLVQCFWKKLKTVNFPVFSHSWSLKCCTVFRMAQKLVQNQKLTSKTILRKQQPQRDVLKIGVPSVILVVKGFKMWYFFHFWWQGHYSYEILIGKCRKRLLSTTLLGNTFCVLFTMKMFSQKVFSIILLQIIKAALWFREICLILKLRY